MTAAVISGFSPRESSDRNFFLLILAGIWGGVIAGFVPDSLNHLMGGHVPYAAIVHVHAASYVAWLVLLTTQMTLIRSDQTALHRRLGLAALVMIPWMVVVGAATAVVMGGLELGTPDGDAPFLILPVLSVLSFAALSFTSLAFRANAAVHKRLMLIGTLIITDAGFGRWIGPVLGPFLGRLFGRGFIAFHVPHFIGSDILMATILAYDLATRRRVHPVVGTAVLLAVAVQFVITLIYVNPAWTPIATRILGH